jgi:aminomuconate-semialdehyde/2-hydroxymuconate-6-semialdehyde dehydrogenase
MTAHLLAGICREAGVPDGAFHIVHGRGAEAGAALVAHPDVPAISFTGGTATGREIGAVAARTMKKVSLELGGKNPTLVFADADLSRAVPESVRAAFSNQGEICLAGSRILVEEKLYPEFLERFVDAARDLAVGDPRDRGTDLGALVSAGHREKVLSYLEIAREEGARVRLGGGVPEDLPPRCRDGYFVLPTVLTDLDPGGRVMQEEIFGPVVTVTPFRTEAEALAIANGTPYGLAASIWTRDLDRAHRVAAAVESGIIWVNCWMLRDLRTPFGGMKQSGVGREGGEEAIRFFTEPRNVCIRLGEEGAGA